MGYIIMDTMNAKHPPMTYHDMIEDAKEIRENSKLYKAKSLEISDERITSIIAKCTADLASIVDGKHITLNDTEMVQDYTIAYFSACAKASCFPSVSGWARSMGLSRRAIYDFRNAKPDHDTSKWIDLMLDTFSDILSEAALRNNCNSIIAIFIQKAQYGMKEHDEHIKPVMQDQLGETLSAEEIKNKYKDLPED